MNDSSVIPGAPPTPQWTLAQSIKRATACSAFLLVLVVLLTNAGSGGASRFGGWRGTVLGSSLFLAYFLIGLSAFHVRGKVALAPRAAVLLYSSALASLLLSMTLWLYISRFIASPPHG